MAENKHSEISKTLEKAIRSGKYFERIPPVRTLAREFGVSLQTMSKALKTLQRDGLLISGPGGTRIVEKIPYNLSGRVVLVFSFQENILQTDPLWLVLQEEAAKDNTSLVTVLLNDIDLFFKQTFRESLYCDGCIFLYRSFYPIVGMHQPVSGIPFVVGNWLPSDLKIHSVDFDWKNRLFQLVRILCEKSYTKIAYLPNLHWKFGMEFHFSMWQDVCSSYDIVNYTPGVSFFGMDARRNLERIFNSKHGMPEIIILTHSVENNIRKFLDEFNYSGKILLPDVYQKMDKDSRFIFYNSCDYRKLGKKIWEVFKQISEGRSGNCYEHLVPAGDVRLLQ